jgi:hypothetical protein
MATVKLPSDDELSPEARVIFDDIRRTRQSDFVSDFWRALAHDPKTLGRPWESVKEVMAPGALEPRSRKCSTSQFRLPMVGPGIPVRNIRVFGGLI